MKKKHTKKKQKGGFVTTILGTALASSVIGLTGKAAMSSPSNNIDANNIDANNIELGSINLLLDTPIGDLEKRTLRQYLEAMKTGLCPKSLKEQTKQIVEKNSSDFSEEQKEKIAQFEKEKEQYEAEKEELKVLEKEGNNEKIEEKKKTMSLKKKALIASGLVLGAGGVAVGSTFLASELGNENAKQLLGNAEQFTSQSPEELMKTVEGFTKNMSNAVDSFRQGADFAKENFGAFKHSANSIMKNPETGIGGLKSLFGVGGKKTRKTKKTKKKKNRRKRKNKKTYNKNRKKI
jgi:hypothetical protein